MITTGKTYKEKIVHALNKLADVIDPDGDTNDNVLFKDSSDDVIAGSLERIADHYEAGGGGGGGGVQIVRITEYDALDKTYAEIQQMLENGPVFAILAEPDGFGFLRFVREVGSQYGSYYVSITNIGNYTDPTLIYTNIFWAESENDYPSYDQDEGGGIK